MGCECMKEWKNTSFVFQISCFSGWGHCVHSLESAEIHVFPKQVRCWVLMECYHKGALLSILKILKKKAEASPPMPKEKR